MRNKVIVKKIPVTEFINILMIFERKGKKFINLECFINEVQDDVRVFNYKKPGKAIKRKGPLTDKDIIDLLDLN